MSRHAADTRDPALVLVPSEGGSGRPSEGLATFGRRFAELPRAPLGRCVWVVSDVHLPPEADARTERFVAWCDAVRALASGRAPTRADGHAPAEGRAPAGGAARVVCLGDLFDVWVGRCQLALSGTAPVADALARLVAAGVAVDLLPGNRDTLLDAAFERRSGVTLRRDGLVLTGADGGACVLCLHGDELCIREPGYLRLRRTMRSGWFRAVSRVAPLWFARAVGRRLRERYSGALGRRRPERGPQPDAAFAAAWGAGVRLLLSGHSHAPADDVLPSAGLLPVSEVVDPVRWVTLGAFGDGADVVWLDAAGAPEVLSASP